MLSGIPQVAQIGPSLVAKNGTPFCLFTIEEIRDILRDYDALAEQYQAMYQRFGVAEPVVRKDGVWHCPSCNRRANQYHSYCHACGKKLAWGCGKGGRRYG